MNLKRMGINKQERGSTKATILLTLNSLRK